MGTGAAGSITLILVAERRGTLLQPGNVKVNRAVPNLRSDRPAETREFFVDLLGFEAVMDLGWVATMASPTNPSAQVTIIGNDDPAAPGISVEVDDVDAVHACTGDTRASATESEMGKKLSLKSRQSNQRSEILASESSPSVTSGHEARRAAAITESALAWIVEFESGKVIRVRSISTLRKPSKPPGCRSSRLGRKAIAGDQAGRRVRSTIRAW